MCGMLPFMCCAIFWVVTNSTAYHSGHYRLHLLLLYRAPCSVDLQSFLNPVRTEHDKPALVCVCRASECIECLTWADAHTQYLQCTECDCTLLPLALSAPLHLKSPPRSVYRVEVKICEQRTQTVGGKDHWTAGLQFNKTGFDQKRK